MKAMWSPSFINNPNSPWTPIPLNWDNISIHNAKNITIYRNK
jgi:hypothetical protein